ncbi:MAG: hypothetical protein KTV77_03425 [Wolbachia endosymbiont of Fragariocoptes setiger]|nr:hypothetical protein [Wolbachia endosymbiont of Fragariocoptes setiger]
MTAGLRFYNSKDGSESNNPSQTKYVCYTDADSNEYSIDFSNDKFKLGYKPSGGSLTENEIGLTTVDTSNFVKTDGIGLDKIFVEKLLEVKDGTDNALEKSLSNTFLNKNDATDTDVTNLLNKITTADHKPITVSELPTKIVDNTVTTALSNTFLKTDASNFENSKRTDFLIKLGTDNTQVANKIAEKVAASIPNTTTTALMSVAENHNEEGLVPSYDTLWKSAICCY